MGPSRQCVGVASAVLPGRDEHNFAHTRGGPAGGGGKKMGSNVGKTSKTQTPYPNFSTNKKLQSHALEAYEINDESPATLKPPAATSVNRKSGDDFSRSQYMSIDISSCSRKELMELKNRLLGELDQIRQLTDRIESGKLSGRSGQNMPQPKRPVDGKKMSGNKRPLPPNSGKDVKRINNFNSGVNGDAMKSCALMLTKLMKLKSAYAFKAPVDVVGLKLHDYHSIVKKPMDLGTVKSKLSRNLYATPMDFAEDVKLTFSNAMLYNPIGHDVYVKAEQLNSRFEELFKPMYKKMEEEQHEKFEEEQQQEQVDDEQRLDQFYDEDLASSWNNVELERARNDSALPIGKKYERILSQPPRSQSPVMNPEPMRPALVKPVKQPKPKAKDPNKREMSLEERHKLGVGLQNLPQDKMEQVVQIISKRNGHLSRDGDEIELDIEAVDTETLWELDRYVTNWKKAMNKIKRQALLDNSGIEHILEDPEPEIEHIDVGVDARTPRRETGDEDVDIGDDMPMSNYAPVEIEKDVGGASSSSNSSGSDSSSSSDSDSGSSSGSDSEADNAHS